MQNEPITPEKIKVKNTSRKFAINTCMIKIPCGKMIELESGKKLHEINYPENG
jgi:hypothetical protein